MPARKKGKAGGDGKGGMFATIKTIAEEYILLCHDPLNDLDRWMAEDRRWSGGPSYPIEITARKDQAYALSPSTFFLDDSHRLLSNSLQKLRRRLDTPRKGRRNDYRMLSRSGASTSRDGTLRSLRDESGGSGESRSGPSVRHPGVIPAISGSSPSPIGESMALLAFAVAKKEVTWRNLLARAVGKTLRPVTVLISQARRSRGPVDPV